MSMLASAQREALEDARAQEEGATLEAEKERLKLRGHPLGVLQSGT